jgi:FtsP/CotA-like multicopper oxidase with cupredoxin domain
MSNDRTKPLSSGRTRSAARRAVVMLGRGIARRCGVAVPTAIVALTAGMPLAQASPCPSGEPFAKIPEIVWHTETLPNGKKVDILRGLLRLTDTQVNMMTRFGPGGVAGGTTPGTPGAVYECNPQTVRAFRLQTDYGIALARGQTLPDPFPAPTLRARLGGLVQLTFINQVDPARFPLTAETSGNSAACDVVVPVYPGPDKYPDCFHGSSSGNIHFHGTHTNPNGTADNVLLALRPSPRDGNNRPTIGPDTYKKEFDKFFAECAEHLAGSSLLEWPQNWNGPTEPGGSSLGPWNKDTDKTWTWLQMKALGTSDHDANEKVAKANKWPQYYIGAYPYCYQLPAYTGSYPPAPGALQMGQSPGTHWYHAHKHGSTSIDVANGMVGAFIIEGPSYDDELNKFYGANWTRSQPVMVINQPGTSPNKMRPGGGRSQDKGPDLVVNGRFQSIIDMAPGEVQMWRMVNGSGRSGALLSGFPSGFRFRQIAQDGVQFADKNYQSSEGQPILLASGNRADLLVMASTIPGIYPVMVQHEVDPIDVNPNIAGTANPVILLMVRVNPSLPLVTDNRTKFIPNMPKQPDFLGNITTAQANAPRAPPPCKALNPSSSSPCGTADNPRVVTFSSGGPGIQHMIDGKPFAEDPDDTKTVTLNTVEEWQIENAGGTPGPASHPFHIHVNPFQIVEIFDPNQQVLTTNQTRNRLVAKYVTTTPTDSSVQCQIDPGNRLTWVDCHNPLTDESAPRVWWDVFSIPSPNTSIQVTVPGYTTLPGHFRMRSRFVDFPGVYVIHCHILAHEDRGMMAIIELKAPDVPSAAALFQHH